MAQSQIGPDIETEAARQAHFVQSGQRFLEYLTHVVHVKGTKELWLFTSNMPNVV
jgi:hypothetical protein